MFNSTHTLTGLVLAKAGFDDWTPRATLTAMIAANLPDIDIITGFPGSTPYIEHHRGVTHGVLGILLLSLILAVVLVRFTGNFWRTLVVALAAMATHPALDYANTYGIQPWLPFSETRYYGDTLNVIDPYLDAILFTGVAAGRLMRRKRSLAWTALTVAAVYLGGRVELRDIARARIDEFAARTPQAVRSSVIPEMIDPRRFAGVVETRDEYIKVRFNAFQARQTVEEELARVPKGDFSSAVVRAAAASPAGTVFRSFARYPAVDVEEIPEGYRVVMFDFRFFNERNGTAFGAEMLIDGDLRLREDHLAFGMPLQSRISR